MAKKYSVLETWIVNEAKPTDSNSAEQTYERMDKQGGGKLPVVDVPLDFRKEEHFVDEAQIRDLVVHLGNAQEILDIGPGDGWPMLRLAPFFRSVTGIEPSAKRVACITENIARLGVTNATVKQMNALELDFPTGSFDAVVATTAIEQTPDPFQALREVYRVLKPGGRFRVVYEGTESQDKGYTERMFTTKTADSFGFHYVLRHTRPAWERNYLVKFAATPEMAEEFRKLEDLVGRIGDNPTQNPEIGLQFLERNRAQMTGATWYELEHFTAESMKDTLDEIGFINIKSTYSAGTLARWFWPRVADHQLSEQLARDICQGLADIAVKMEAPVHLGEPITAVKPR
jgi:ubiquinone/menaquinone biosynthesis C-methylase UbiE